MHPSLNALHFLVNIPNDVSLNSVEEELDKLPFTLRVALMKQLGKYYISSKNCDKIEDENLTIDFRLQPQKASDILKLMEDSDNHTFRLMSLYSCTGSFDVEHVLRSLNDSSHIIQKVAIRLLPSIVSHCECTASKEEKQIVNQKILEIFSKLNSKQLTELGKQIQRQRKKLSTTLNESKGEDTTVFDNYVKSLSKSELELKPQLLCYSTWNVIETHFNVLMHSFTNKMWLEFAKDNGDNLFKVLKIWKMNLMQSIIEDNAKEGHDSASSSSSFSSSNNSISDSFYSIPLSSKSFQANSEALSTFVNVFNLTINILMKYESIRERKNEQETMFDMIRFMLHVGVLSSINIQQMANCHPEEVAKMVIDEYLPAAKADLMDNNETQQNIQSKQLFQTNFRVGCKNFPVFQVSFAHLAGRLTLNSLTDLLTIGSRPLVGIRGENLISSNRMKYVKHLSLKQCIELLKTEHPSLRDGEGNLREPLKKRLPRELQKIELLRRAERERIKMNKEERPEDKLPYAVHLPFDECLAVEQSCIHNVDINVRTKAIVTLIQNIAAWKEHQDDLMDRVMEMKKDQDNVRTAILNELQAFPLYLFDTKKGATPESKQKFLTQLGQYFRSCLDDIACSSYSVSLIEQIAMRLLPIDVPFAAEQLKILVKERNCMLYCSDLQKYLKDATEAEVDIILKVFEPIFEIHRRNEDITAIIDMIEKLPRNAARTNEIWQLLEKQLEKEENVYEVEQVLMKMKDWKPFCEKAKCSSKSEEKCEEKDQKTEEGKDEQMLKKKQTKRRKWASRKRPLRLRDLKKGESIPFEELDGNGRVQAIMNQLIEKEDGWIKSNMFQKFVFCNRQDLLSRFIVIQKLKEVGEKDDSSFSPSSKDPKDTRADFVLDRDGNLLRMTTTRQQERIAAELDKVIYAETQMPDVNVSTNEVIGAIKKLATLKQISTQRILRLAKEDEREIVFTAALQALPRLVTDEGIEMMFYCLKDEKKSRVCVKGLESSIVSMPPLNALDVLHSLSIKKLSLAKERIRLTLKLHDPELVWNELMSLPIQKLHRDVQVVILNGLKDNYITRKETWDIMKTFTGSTEPALVEAVFPLRSLVSSDQGKHLTLKANPDEERKEIDETLAEAMVEQLLRLIDNPDITVKQNVLNERGSITRLVDPSRRIVKRMAEIASAPIVSRKMNTLSLTALHIVSDCLSEKDIDLACEFVRKLFDFPVKTRFFSFTNSVIGKLTSSIYKKPDGTFAVSDEWVKISKALLPFYESHPSLAADALMMRTIVVPADEFLGYLEEEIKTGRMTDLDSKMICDNIRNTLLFAQIGQRTPYQIRGSTKKADPVEKAMAAHSSACVRNISFALMQCEPMMVNGERKQLLMKMKEDPDRHIARKAFFLWANEEEREMVRSAEESL
ncbi:uncharacterized protein MONOS_108 [Monocercomonoides exilis]|uniref:uncharacterized protein n=1 Tax=Monocercomonoides exilis TaxID=2049356 RepID=UPI00355992BA|nr:hypothetical protein MONOS_108 [Monocercomonoides exilis]|eukprot:MONOS_108.1-p1 / transcript=MONOS_108.1 / gene=MONOS_108 / organism=Monocercomonoides_exilis_PA203 / gene_product=unspecified product / transcript_product=unspecified product / location=Mono_scaffold00002:144801-149012(+) / protein_length=1404 / sequence_SO=supercontig / SO=protein_coding / is_pseudo=false